MKKIGGGTGLTDGDGVCSGGGNFGGGVGGSNFTSGYGVGSPVKKLGAKRCKVKCSAGVQN